DPGAGRAEGPRVGEAELLGGAARVLVDGDQRGCPLALGVEAPDEVPGRLWCDEHHVHARRWPDLPEVDVEAVREEERLAPGEVLDDLRLVDLLLRLIRREDHDQVRLARRLGDGDDPEARRVRLGTGSAGRMEPDPDVNARVAEVQGVRMSLAPVSDDGDLSI